jgi:S1-C subfamily serine protease
MQDFFGDNMGTQKTGTGSGVVISEKGLIVTNNHVVDGATKVVVRTSDHRSYDATVLGTDKRSDLAVLKISATNLQPIDIGTSKTLAPGQWVMAVGNPLGLDDTITVGVVSSVGREVPVGERGMVDAIQTDAAINPGNSGGALCNSQGQLVGINAALENPSGLNSNVGIGFAIPVERVKQVVDDIVKYGYVKYGALGISYAPNWDGALSDANLRSQLSRYISVPNLPDHGVVVTSVSGAAAQAGIQKYDVIQSIDGESVDNSLDLNKATIAHKPGDTVKVTVWSHGKVATKTLVMEAMPRSA